MPANEKSKSLVKEVADSLGATLALFAIYAASNEKAVRDRVSKQGTGVTFNLLREVLHRQICLQVTGLFDRDTRTISFSNLGRELTLDTVDDKELLAAANDLTAKTMAEPWLVELKTLRDKVIAHRDREPDHDARYGHERKLLEAASAILAVFGNAVGTRFVIENFAAAYGGDAKAFWDNVGTQ